MTDFDVSRRRFQSLLERAGDDDALLAELLVAEHYDVLHAPDETDWYDCRNQRTGTKFEVKSTRTSIDGEDPSTFVDVAGRFRLWRSQVRSLLASDARGTAWIVFVLFDEDRTPVALKRMRPGTVSSLVDEWNESGHEMGPQHKVPISEVFSR